MNEALLKDHRLTGIKIKEGVPHYRCRYHCRNCGTRSNQYVQEGDKFTDCHNCGTALAIEAALPEGFPIQDGNGNFYIAVGPIPPQTQAPITVPEREDPLIQARYNCPCGNSGTRMLSEHSTFVRCHKCSAKLKLDAIRRWNGKGSRWRSACRLFKARLW